MKQKVAVLGSGTMGHCIAESFAMGGYQVNLYDINDQILSAALDNIKLELGVMVKLEYLTQEEADAALGNITTYTDLRAATEDRDYVIEAIPENLQLKQDTLAKLDSWCPAHTIFASNTSSLKLEAMAEVLTPERKRRFAINHWFNPAHIVPLVELSDYGNNDPEVLKEIHEMYIALGKKPAYVRKDVAGLLANRLQEAVMREVFSLIEMGAAEPEDLDNALKYGPGFRYPLAGPLEIVDFGGVDIWYTEAAALLPDMDNSKEPNKLLAEKMEKGELGIKTGKGYYDYTDRDIDKIKQDYNERLIRQLKTSKEFFM